MTATTAWVLPCVFLGAIGFRIRGGMTEGWRYQLPGQLARLVWALACAITALAAGAVWWEPLALIVSMFGAATLPLWDTIDMGRNQGTFARDFALGTVHGLCLGACASVVLLVAGGLWWLPLVGGALWATCYALAWLKLSYPWIIHLGLGKYGNPPELAELLFGFEFTVLLYLAALQPG